jgi:hypothetical protein
MHLIWHIVRKDLRRLLPWLALLIGAMLARYFNFYAPGYVPEHNDLSALWQRAGIINDILLGLSLFATALAAATLVHDDAVIGDRTFWLTRPISGGRLLAAKTLTFTLALVVLPLVIQLGWWLFQRYSFADIAAQFPPMFARQAGTAFAAFCFALLTRNLGSFILTTLITTFAIVAAHGVLVEQWLKLPSRTDDYNRTILELILALAVLPALIVYQYLTRRTRHTLVLFGGLVALCLSIHAAWPWPLFQKTSRLEAMPALTADPATTASINTPVPARHPRRNWSAPAPHQFEKIPVLAFDLTLGPIPSDHVVQIIKASFPKQTPLILQYQHRPSIPRPAFPESYSDTSNLLIFRRGDSSAPEPQITSPIQNTLTLGLRQPQASAGLPLSIDTTASFGPRHLRIVSIRNLNTEKIISARRQDGKVVTTRITASAQKFALILEEIIPSYLLGADRNYSENDDDSYYYSPDAVEPASHLGEGHSRHAYFLISRRDGTATRADNILVRGKLSADGVRRRLVRTEFPLRLQESDLADYELVKVVAPLVGTFTRTITFPPTPWTAPATP